MRIAKKKLSVVASFEAVADANAELASNAPPADAFDRHEIADISIARQSREFAGKFQAIFDQASDAIITILPDGKIDTLNQAAEELTGFMRDELVGQAFQSLVPIPAKHHVPDRTRPLTLDILSKPGTYEEMAIVRKDGFVRLVDVSVRQVQSGKDLLSLALIRDVTEKKMMERELITKHGELRNAYFQLEKNNAELKSMQETLVQAGKMAALGELAAGIAHELNQPLQGIRGYAQELESILGGQTEGAPDGPTSAALKEIISNVDKMKSIIGYLRTFIRKSTEDHEFTDVHGRIEEAFKMLARQFAARGIVVHRKYEQNLPAIYGNPLQIEQVFINLATNARDAIEQTGRGSGNIWVTTRPHGDFVEIDFRDDGAGMDARTKAKAFNPFFTTKEVGKGMGLGLSLSYGMISKLHGSIVVESEIGRGAQFRIRLPKDFRELA